MAYNPLARGTAFKAPARGVQTNFQNGTIVTLAKGTVVATNSSGQIIVIDVSSESAAQALVGLTGIAIPSGASGAVLTNGRLEEFTTSFTIGDAIYVGKDGLLTNVKPSEGVNSFVSGDFVIFVGVVVKNEFDPGKKDIQLMFQMIGQL